MPSNYSFVTGKTQLIDPNNGSFVDTWDQPCNSNFGVIDASVSGTTVINISANTTPGTPYVTLTFPTFPTYSQPWTQPLAAQNLRLLLTGALSYNVSVYIPANVPGMWLVDNQTTNGFTITIKTNAAGSQGVAVPQGYTSFIFCDGTNVNWADQGNLLRLNLGIAYTEYTIESSEVTTPSASQQSSISQEAIDNLSLSTGLINY